MLRVIFMGTPDFSVPALSEILNAGHEVVAVYTQPPRPAGRGMGARKASIHALADDSGLPVFTPERLKSEAEQERFASHAADIAIVVAYGLILPKQVLETPVHGCLNLHASLLPRWRGAAPIQRAIMAGDKETGVMIMRMDEGLDTGPVCLGENIAIGADVTAGELHDMLARQGGDLLVRALAALERGSLDCKPQAQEGATYAKKIEKTETRIDWTRPASEVHNHIRGLSPWPGAWFEMEFRGKTERVKVLRSERASGSGTPGSLIADSLTIACGSESVRLLQLQRAGKKPMERQEFLRGVDISTGVVLR